MLKKICIAILASTSLIIVGFILYKFAISNKKTRGNENAYHETARKDPFDIEEYYSIIAALVTSYKENRDLKQRKIMCSHIYYVRLKNYNVQYNRICNAITGTKHEENLRKLIEPIIMEAHKCFEGYEDVDSPMYKSIAEKKRHTLDIIYTLCTQHRNTEEFIKFEIKSDKKSHTDKINANSSELCGFQRAINFFNPDLYFNIQNENEIENIMMKIDKVYMNYFEIILTLK